MMQLVEEVHFGGLMDARLHAHRDDRGNDRDIRNRVDREAPSLTEARNQQSAD